jgi:hypothetical protein
VFLKSVATATFHGGSDAGRAQSISPPRCDHRKSSKRSGHNNPATTKVVGADACPLFVPKHPAAADGAWQRLLSASAFEAVASCQQWKSSGIFQAADDRFFSARNHV